MAFELRSASGGPVLWVSGFLHATNLIACLSARTGFLELRPGEPALVELVFDRADRCATPVTIATMAVVVEGPVETASRQEWALRYTFAP